MTESSEIFSSVSTSTCEEGSFKTQTGNHYQIVQVVWRNPFTWKNEEEWSGIFQCLHCTCHWDQGTSLSQSHWSNLLHSTVCNYPVWHLDGVWMVVTPVSSIHISYHMSKTYVTSIKATPLNNISKLLEKCLHIWTVKACSSRQASCLCIFHGHVRMPFNKAWEPIRTCHVVLIPWLGVFYVVLDRKLICKLPDLKEGKTN